MSLIMLAIYVSFIVWAVKIAEKNGRSKGLACFWGIMLGLWAVILYAIMGKSANKIREDEEDRVKRTAEMLKSLKD